MDAPSDEYCWAHRRTKFGGIVGTKYSFFPSALEPTCVTELVELLNPLIFIESIGAGFCRRVTSPDKLLLQAVSNLIVG